MEVVGFIYGVRPWNSIEADRKVKIETHDTQKNINKCLSCEYSECCNCLSNRPDHIGKRRRSRKYDIEVIKGLLLAGVKIAEIAEIVGCSCRTVYECRKSVV